MNFVVSERMQGVYAIEIFEATVQPYIDRWLCGAIFYEGSRIQIEVETRLDLLST